MTVGFVIGNGTSRVGFNLEWLHGRGVTIGCNFLYRDFTPDYLVALDLAVIEEIEAYREENTMLSVFLSRHMDHGKNWGQKLLENGAEIYELKYLNGGHINNSGLLSAAYLAEIKGIDTIYLLGIDFFRRVPGGTNDIYSGEIGFSNSLVAAWNMLTERNQKTDFIRVGEIIPSDEEFYMTQLYGFSLIETFDEFKEHVEKTNQCLT
jgi:hypothetical protein